MENSLNKLYGLLTYGYAIHEDSPFYKKHSLALPSANVISIRDALYTNIQDKYIAGCSYLICSLMPESSSWERIKQLDPNNTYHISRKDSQLAGVASLLDVDKAIKLLPPDTKNLVHGYTWLDSLGAISVELLQGSL
jgi:hypothetical protein